jgi:hypothetical protein
MSYIRNWPEGLELTTYRMHANHYTSDADISVAIDSNKKKLH